jgi:hypothetical protein
VTVLNQIIAIEKGVKKRTEQEVATIVSRLQHPNALAGISRTYKSLDEEGEQFPPESTLVQVRAEDELVNLANLLERLMDVVATKEHANTTAFADIIVNDEVILGEVPVTFLLFLEKQLASLATIVRGLPRLNPGEEWEYDANADAFASPVVDTAKTKKVPRTLTKAEATEFHPAQVDVWSEDMVVGYWSTAKFSGALPARRIKDILHRIELMQDAVQFAREQANSQEVEDRDVGGSIMSYLFG